MTEISIISGFLGAGKTKLIRQLAQRCLLDARLFALENDFGETGVDAAVLGQERMKVVDMSAGCICCNLNMDFVKKLRRVREELKPDVILVEPSGISKSSEVIQGCLREEAQGGFRLGRVMIVADVRNFRKYRENYGAFFEDQLAYADVIFLSHQEDAAAKVPKVIVLHAKDIQSAQEPEEAFVYPSYF